MKSFVFDLDGTLLNTLADIAGACNVVLGQHGYPQHPPDAYRLMVGNGFDILIRRALPAGRMPDACAIDEITREARAYYAGHMMDQTAPYSGMNDTLAALAARDKKLAVLSNKPDAMSAALISHYFPGIPFFRVQGARPGIPLKPDPGALLSIISDMGISESGTSYVGDSHVDIETARNARITGIGVAWGFRGAGELAEAGADAIIAKPEDLLAL